MEIEPVLTGRHPGKGPFNPITLQAPVAKWPPPIRLPYSLDVELIYPPLPKKTFEDLCFDYFQGSPDDQEVSQRLFDPMAERLNSLEDRLARLEGFAQQQQLRDEQPARPPDHLASIAANFGRLVEKLAPGARTEIVGSRYVADRLDCSTQWIGEMVRTGKIPRSCVAEGTGNGKPWKFHKAKIDDWLKTR
jgi:hypothetical protein